MTQPAHRGASQVRVKPARMISCALSVHFNSGSPQSLLVELRAMVDLPDQVCGIGQNRHSSPIPKCRYRQQEPLQSTSVIGHSCYIVCQGVHVLPNNATPGMRQSKLASWSSWLTMRGRGIHISTCANTSGTEATTIILTSTSYTHTHTLLNTNTYTHQVATSVRRSILRRRRNNRRDPHANQGPATATQRLLTQESSRTQSRNNNRSEGLAHTRSCHAQCCLPISPADMGM